MAQDVLALLAAGVGVEHIFNSSCDVCHYQHGHLNPETIRDNLVLLCTDWFHARNQLKDFIDEMDEEDWALQAQEDALNDDLFSETLTCWEESWTFPDVSDDEDFGEGQEESDKFDDGFDNAGLGNNDGPDEETGQNIVDEGIDEQWNGDDDQETSEDEDDMPDERDSGSDE